MWRVTGFLIAVISFCAIWVSESCEVAEIMECQKYIPLADARNIFNRDRPDVTMMCQAVNKMKTCTSTMSSCGPVFKEFVDVSEIIITAMGVICKDKESVDRFEEFRTCYEEHYEYIRECYNRSAENLGEEMFTEKFCKVEEQWMMCFVNRTGEECSKNVMDLVVQLVKETERPYNKHCDPKISILTDESGHGSNNGSTEGPRDGSSSNSTTESSDESSNGSTEGPRDGSRSNSTTESSNGSTIYQQLWAMLCMFAFTTVTNYASYS